MSATGTDPLDMEATLTSPSGKTECCEIRGMPDNLCSLKFTPVEDGVNTISLKCKGIHFAGISNISYHVEDNKTYYIFFTFSRYRNQ